MIPAAPADKGYLMDATSVLSTLAAVPPSIMPTRRDSRAISLPTTRPTD
ncbi:hypothetical protein [Streptomyces sp. NPDC001933]